jgi:hypothetical protein
MLRFALALLAVALTGTSAAASNYTAKPVVPANGRFIARDIVWNCGAAACQGATEESRPVVLCQSLAKQAGKIDSFLVDGRAFTPAELQQCNTAAKAAPAQSLAAQ